MKVLLNFSLLTLFLTISNEIFSQDFISENKTWNVVVKVGFDEYITTKTVTYKFLGDTTIQQINYKKLLEADNEQKSNWKLNSLWFEKNDSVFKYSSMHDENILIYDFNIAEKDSFTIMENVFYLIVDSIRTKAWGGKEREFIYFHPSEIYSNWGQTVWIKGVGQTGDFTRSTEIGIVGAFCSLLCFEENGELVYQNPQYNDCYINTSVSAQNISITDSLNRWNIGLNCVSEEPIDPYNRWSTYFVHIEGDTLFNNKHYKKLFHCADSTCINKDFKSYIREDSGKVFMANKARELILYDFNLNQGDSLIMYFLRDDMDSNPLFIQVDSVKTGVFQDQKERIMQFVSVYDYHHKDDYSLNDVFVEGIGSLKFGLEYPGNLFFTGSSCLQNLLCFYINDNLIYNNPEFNNCYITTGINQVQLKPELVNVFSAQNGILVAELSSSVPGTIFVFNSLGELVSQEKILNSTSRFCMPGSGVYLYRFVSDDGQTQTGKVFIR